MNYIITTAIITLLITSIEIQPTNNKLRKEAKEFFKQTSHNPIKKTKTTLIELLKIVEIVLQENRLSKIFTIQERKEIKRIRNETLESFNNLTKKPLHKDLIAAIQKSTIDLEKIQMYYKPKEFSQDITEKFIDIQHNLAQLHKSINLQNAKL